MLLHAIPFLEHKRILKVFTPQKGLLSLMARYSSAKPNSLTSPFCRAEWVFDTSQQEIHSLKDAALIDPLLDLRGSFAAIQAAGSIAKDLLRSQVPNKASPLLYDMLVSYLGYLPKNPDAASQSFRLKLLQNEGFLHLKETCAECSDPIDAISQGECFCRAHAPPQSFLFQGEDRKHLLALGLARRFSDLDSCRPSNSFFDKMDRLFASTIS